MQLEIKKLKPTCRDNFIVSSVLSDFLSLRLNAIFTERFYCMIMLHCRSKMVSRLADTSISTTSFGRQQLASFTDHYLSDFVLHGTSDDNVIPQVLLQARSNSTVNSRVFWIFVILSSICYFPQTEILYCVYALLYKSLH